MKSVLLFVLGLLSVGCQQRQPAISDEEWKAIRAENPGMSNRCLNQIRYGGVEAWPDDESLCFEMTPAQRWRGVWIRGFEWTNFCPDPAKTCPIFGVAGVSWLTFTEAARPKHDLPEGLYRIDFVGRQTKMAGHFGHLNQYDHWMIVDQLISIKQVPKPPAQVGR